MFFTLKEFFDMIVMSLAIGFIFSDFFSTYKHRIPYYSQGRFDWNSFWFSVLLVAPTIILHEFGHKFTAMAFGLHAVFHAAYFWLLIAVLLKLIHSPFLFFVPAYVSIYGPASPGASALIAFAGPAVNLLLFLISKLVIPKASKRNLPYWMLFSKINFFFFIFNMLPIPGFDGFTVYFNLFKIIF